MDFIDIDKWTNEMSLHFNDIELPKMQTKTSCNNYQIITNMNCFNFWRITTTNETSAECLMFLGNFQHAD